MNQRILSHFKKNDPILYSTALKVKVARTIKKENPKNYFLKLCQEIIGQQLSGKVADVIFNRFKNLYSNDINPKVVFNTPHEKLRGIGMSNAKAKYVKNLAETIIKGIIVIDRLDDLSDEKVKKELLQVKGIGPWTVEMFLMFTLARPDVFSHGDLGLKKGIKKIYRFKKDPSIKTVERIIKKWSPYKTYACLILWESIKID